MQTQYTCLLNLLESDNDAQHYYSSLPAFIKEQIYAQSNSMKTINNLQDYAENMMGSDG